MDPAAKPVPNRFLVFEGNRITLLGEAEGSMRPETPDDRVIDATGKFILPGLIDAHCHISLHQGALPPCFTSASLRWEPRFVAGLRRTRPWRRPPCVRLPYVG